MGIVIGDLYGGIAARPVSRHGRLEMLRGCCREATARRLAGCSPESLRAGTGQNAKLAQALALKMPDARVEVFDGIGHLAQLEAEPRFNEVMLKFLGGGQ